MTRSNGPQLRIAIADDHALFRQGLSALLQLEADIRLVAEIERVDDIAPTLARTPCDILLLDLQMDRNALADIPAFAQRVSVAVVTASEETEAALAAFRAGARAVVFKRFAVEELLDAIRAVARGEVCMPRALQARIISGLGAAAPEPLTSRERDVIRHVALGLHNAEVARRLLISEQTVKTHLNNIFHKVGVRDRVELALYAARAGIIGIHERRPTSGDRV
jgi:DNA-binding NarL/FixJ family response regulator